MRTFELKLFVGSEEWTLITPEQASIVRVEPPTTDLADQVRAGLTTPHGLGAALRRAITPDDRVAVILDEGVPQIPVILSEILAELNAGGIEPTAVTVVVPQGGGQGTWIDELPDEWADITLEVHDPEERTKLAYLATTAAGRRVYLNRSVVEADFVVVVSRRRFDPTFGISGAATAIFPSLSEPDALVETVGHFRTRAPGAKQAPIVVAAEEIAWLLGLPFFVQILEGEAGTIQEVIAGPPYAIEHANLRLNQTRRVQLQQAPDLVVCTIRHTATSPPSFADLAMALAAGARIVEPGGKVVLLTQAAPTLDEGADLIRRASDPAEVPNLLKKRKPDDWPFAQLWVQAAQRARIYLAAAWSDEVIEEFFATPLRTNQELQRLLEQSQQPCIVYDAHLMMLEIQGETT